MLHFLGNLLVITPQFLFWLGVVALVTWAVFVAVVRWRHRAVAVAVGALGLVLTLATAADAVNAHYQYLPRVNDVIGVPTWPEVPASHALSPVPQTHPHGAVVRIAIPGTVSGFQHRHAMVYLPPQYFTDTTRRFPVVYLLHGTPGAPIDWFRAAGAAQAGLSAADAGSPVILVAARVSRKWTDDSECVDRPAEHIETYVTEDVVPAIDAGLRTIPDAGARGLAGMSAGGYCALNIGLRHRDEFHSIIDMSGFDRPTFDGGMRGLYGPSSDYAALAAADNPSVYATSLAAAPRMTVWLDTGRSDPSARHDVEHMDTVLRARGQDVTLHERPGAHDYGVWKPAFAQALVALAPQLSRAG